VHQLRGFAKHQLEFDPTDSVRKRVSVVGSRDSGTSGASERVYSSQIYQLAYRTWRIDFAIDDRTVVIEKIATGYSADDLASADDKYADKAIHRAFANAFL